MSVTTLQYHREEHTSKFYLIQFRSSWFNSSAARAEAANEACQALILLQSYSRLPSSTSLWKKSPPHLQNPQLPVWEEQTGPHFTRTRFSGSRENNWGRFVFQIYKLLIEAGKQLPSSSPLIGIGIDGKCFWEVRNTTPLFQVEHGTNMLLIRGYLR